MEHTPTHRIVDPPTERLFRVAVSLGGVGWYTVPATSKRKAKEKTHEHLSLSRNPWAQLDIEEGPFIEVHGVEDPGETWVQEKA